MADRNQPDPWPALVLMGVICGIAIGTIIMMLRRRSSPLLLNDNDDSILPPGPDLASVRLDPMMPVRPPSGHPSPLARTTQISTTNPTFLLRAVTPGDWTVRVRVLGPPGSSATFIYSGSQADQYIVPAGGHDTLRLPGYQSLYAVGNVAGVSVSVASGEYK